MESLPIGTSVPTAIHAKLGARIDRRGIIRVHQQGSHLRAFWETIGDALPVFRVDSASQESALGDVVAFSSQANVNVDRVVRGRHVSSSHM